MRSFCSIVLLTFATFIGLNPGALAQTPTPAQQQAIRSSCVADYRANCSSVPTGGMAALVCLEQHEDKLSPGCKTAVSAVESPPTSTSTSVPAAKTTEAEKTDSAASTSSGTAAQVKSTDTSSVEAGVAKPTQKPIAASSAPALSFRGEMRLAAGSCARDFRKFCPNLPVGHGNVLFCLKVHGPRLDSTCQKALVDAGEVF